MTNTTVLERRWRRIFRNHRASGQSVAAFCRQARLSQASFYAWRRRLRSAVGFVEVKLPPETVAETRAIELRLPCGRCVVIRPGFDPFTLRDLLATLESCNADPRNAPFVAVDGAPRLAQHEAHRRISSEANR